jgi:hypothetical protein
MVAHDLAARAGADLRAIGVVLPLAPIAIDDLREVMARRSRAPRGRSRAMPSTSRTAGGARATARP